MTYFLEKIYKFDYDSNCIGENPVMACIRPCNMLYSNIVDFFKKNDGCIDLNGSIATINFEIPFNKHECFSLEEWLIKTQLEKNINLDFESWIIYDKFNYKDYAAKTIDLHTNNVLQDNFDKIIEKLTIKKLKDAFNKSIEFLI